MKWREILFQASVGMPVGHALYALVSGNWQEAVDAGFWSLVTIGLIWFLMARAETRA